MQLQRGHFKVLDFINPLICHWNNVVNNVSFWWSTTWCFCKLSFGVYYDFFLLGNRSGRRKWAIDSQPLLLWAPIQQLAIVLIGIYLYKMSFWQSWQKSDPPTSSPPNTFVVDKCYHFETSLLSFFFFFFSAFLLFEKDYKLFFLFIFFPLWIKNNKKRCLGQLTTQSFFFIFWIKYISCPETGKTWFFFSTLTEHFFN